MPPSQLVEHSDPRTILEQREEEPAPGHHELAFAFGRILSWQLEGRSPTRVGFRTLIVAHKIRPDLAEGMALDDIADLLCFHRSNAHNLSKEFTETFGIRGMHDRSDEAKTKYSESWKKNHPGATALPPQASHLVVVNRFASWKYRLKDKPKGWLTDEVRAGMLRDFAPIAAFLSDLQGF